jgi:mannose-6-phosphate isomerase-like protein (cupin superfamily)
MIRVHYREGPHRARWVGPRVVPVRPIHNVCTGETIAFGPSSEGELTFDVELRPFGLTGGPPHRHAVDEHVEVRSGELLAFVAGRRPRRVQAGRSIDIPSGRWHVLLAPEGATAQVTVQPRKRFDELLTYTAAVGSGDLRPATLRRLNALLREHECAPRFPL